MEVNVTKCQNGHYFDKNKHQVCPHCGAEIFTVAEPEKKKSGKGLFKKKVKEDKNNQEISMISRKSAWKNGITKLLKCMLWNC